MCYKVVLGCAFAQIMKLDLNSDDEKKLVDGVFWNAMDSLSDDDKKLPQVLIKPSSFSCRSNWSHQMP